MGLPIAAASILAKVTRDRYMDALEQTYPGYGWSKHLESSPHSCCVGSIPTQHEWGEDADRLTLRPARMFPSLGRGVVDLHVSFKGYGTALHQAKILELGLTPEHRRSFKPIQALLKA